MIRRYFLRFLFGLIFVVCFSGKSFCSPADDVVNVYKSYLREKNACATYDDYERVSKKYASREKLARMRLPKMKNNPDALKASMFSVIQATIFSLSELEVEKVDFKEDTATMRYSRKLHPELIGEATLVKEGGSWKIETDSLKTR
ncbi:MAG: hypothetical protein NTU54_02695 [Candidatus Omnitrophica bacterium]|nr:hypothetical protein [Candidatus Omnitrophota bacterium]